MGHPVYKDSFNCKDDYCNSVPKYLFSQHKLCDFVDMSEFWLSSAFILFIFPERTLEDHESVLAVYKHHLNCSAGQLHFQKDFRKYEMFINPGVSCRKKKEKTLKNKCHLNLLFVWLSPIQICIMHVAFISVGSRYVSTCIWTRAVLFRLFLNTVNLPPKPVGFRLTFIQ